MTSRLGPPGKSLDECSVLLFLSRDIYGLPFKPLERIFLKLRELLACSVWPVMEEELQVSDLEARSLQLTQ